MSRLRIFIRHSRMDSYCHIGSCEFLDHGLDSEAYSQDISTQGVVLFVLQVLVANAIEGKDY